MSLERLIELKNIFEENEDLIDKTPFELSVLGAFLEKDETPVKIFVAETVDEYSQSNKLKGELILTDKKIIFMTRDENKGEIFEMRYDEMDDFFICTDEQDKSNGIIAVIAEGVHFTFSGLMRFGLKRWEEYVNDKIKELKGK